MNDIDEQKEREKFVQMYPEPRGSKMLHAEWLGKMSGWLAAKRQAREEFLAMLPDAQTFEESDGSHLLTHKTAHNSYRAELLRRMGQ